MAVKEPEVKEKQHAFKSLIQTFFPFGRVMEQTDQRRALPDHLTHGDDGAEQTAGVCTGSPPSVHPIIYQSRKA